MPTLDQISRADLLKVLGNLEYLLGVRDAASAKINEVNNVIDGQRASLKSAKKRRLMWLGFLCFLLCGQFSLAMMLIMGALMTGTEEPVDTTFRLSFLSVGGAIVLLGILVFVFVVIRMNKKNRKDREKAEKYISGIYAYIPFYVKICEEYGQKSSAICQQYSIHPNLAHTSVLSYVRKQLASYPTMSIYKAVDDYYEIQHRQDVIGKLNDQKQVLLNIQKENKKYYEDVLAELERGNAIQRDIRDSVNHIRYW